MSKRKQRRLTAKEIEFLAAHELMQAQMRKLLGVSRDEYTTVCNYVISKEQS